MSLKRKSLELHKKHQGKIEIRSKVCIRTPEDLAIFYSPGVAEPCHEILQSKENLRKYTNHQNTIAIVTDGSAVLGLGNIGPHASLPVMEGKSVLFKQFAQIDAVPITLATQDTAKIIETCKMIAPTFSGINLEDISAPKCITVAETLSKELDIPVFHDDQDGTAIVTAAALINSCRLLGRTVNDLNVALCGTGAAGYAIANLLHALGVNHLYAFNKDGVVDPTCYDQYDFSIQRLIKNNIITKNPNANSNSLQEMLKNTDVFIGVSVGNVLTAKMIRGMNKDPIIFALANPTPEIDPTTALEAGAKIVGTGRSDYHNQINNAVVFPGLFRALLDLKIKTVTEEMKIATAYAIAEVIEVSELKENYIIPSPFDSRILPAIKQALSKK